MTSQAQKRQVQELLESCGCTDIKPRRNKHVKWQFKTPAGHPAAVIAANSPSDKRGLLNLRSTVRSIIREKDNG
jgi:hypothetical protein